MTLRTRLLLVAAATFIVFVGGAVFTVANQERQLVRQVDASLRPPRVRVGSSRRNRNRNAPSPRSGQLRTRWAADPDLYLATIDADGTIVTVVEGQRLTDRPALDDLVADQPNESTFLDVDGVDGSSHFRALTRRPRAMVWPDRGAADRRRTKHDQPASDHVRGHRSRLWP